MNRIKPYSSRRRGALLIVALVCLAIVVAMVGSMLLAALTARRQLRAERDLRQCELLLEAGADRAAYRAAAASDYRGETWNLPPGDIVGAGEAIVTIELSPDSSANSRRFQITAEYPVGDETSIRRSRTISLPTIQSATQE